MTWFARQLADPFGADLEALARGRYGIIETAEGRLSAIWLRPWPKVATTLDVDWLGRCWHERTPGDRCWLYYNQPRRHSSFLALRYVLSNRDCTLATGRRALQVLDEVARVKRSDAIVCDAWNQRISERLLARWGWEPHARSRWHRNYIKRFYGHYAPSRAPAYASVADR